MIKVGRMNEAIESDGSILAKIKPSKASLSGYSKVKSILDKYGDINSAVPFTGYGAKELHMKLKGSIDDLKKELDTKLKVDIPISDGKFSVNVNQKFRIRVLKKSWMCDVSGTALVLDFNPSK